MATPTKKGKLKDAPLIFFQQGLNTFQQNRLLLEDGQSAQLLNADFSNIGELAILWPFTDFKTGLDGRVHSIYVVSGYSDCFVGHGTVFSHIDLDTGDVTELITGLSGIDISMFATDSWLFLTDGITHKKIWLDTLAVYTWGIDNPLTAPSAAVGVTGNPSGTYQLYYTYVAKYPDGTEYETDVSPMGQIIVSSAKIEWTYPLTAPDSQISHLRLYREKDGTTATLDQMREALEAQQAALEVSTNRKTFSRMVQDAVRRASNKAIVQNIAADQNVIVGPFLVDEVEIGSVGYSDNLTDDELVQNVPFLRERYTPIFGA